jgi:hypothetical protein
VAVGRLLVADGVRGEDVFAAGQPRPHDDRSTLSFPVAEFGLSPVDPGR